MIRRTIVLFVVAATLSSEGGHAQVAASAPAVHGARASTRIVGIYASDTQELIAGAEVMDSLAVIFRREVVAFKTDGRSHFTLGPFLTLSDSVMLWIRAVGYQPKLLVASVADTSPIVVQMEPATTLAAVVTTAKHIERNTAPMRGFQQRAESRRWAEIHFIAPEEMRAKDDYTLRSLLAAHGIDVANTRGYTLSNGKPVISCAVLYLVDGIRRAGIDLDRTYARDYEAIEFYNGTEVPAEFSFQVSGNVCRVVLLWSRE